MPLIELTKGRSALVDEVDLAELSVHKWCASLCNGKWYAQARIDGRNVRMHRFLMGVHHSTLPLVDHIDGDGLNNTRCNLRLVSYSHNQYNRKMQKNNTTGYQGVCLAPRGKYRAVISEKGKQRFLGIFDTAEQAHQAYATAAAERREKVK